MPDTNFFKQRPDLHPTIYVYELPQSAFHKGYIKVGYTGRDVMTRIKEQIGATHQPFNVLFQESAMRPDGSSFTDKDVHRLLERNGFSKLNADGDNEWFNCTVKDVIVAMNELKTGVRLEGARTATFGMRPEQAAAVERTMDYYVSAKKDDPNRPPKFLWNAKMRFGKTFASYQLAKKMGAKRVLVLTFKPAVESAWSEDLLTHVDFAGWQFISNKDAKAQNQTIDDQYREADKQRPIVVFGSFQDLLGTTDAGAIKPKNEFIHTAVWDLVIFDEYHYGAWRDNAKKLFENPDEEDVDFDQEKYSREEAGNAYNESFIEITANHFLYLSGTPFRALNNGEFIEEQVYNWTYSDEQRCKEEWPNLSAFPDYQPKPEETNPYAALPRMILMTYQMPDDIRQIAMQGEFNEFDLNFFFSAKVEEGAGLETARFVNETEVQKWLNLIRGEHLPTSIDILKANKNQRPPMPFSNPALMSALTHTLWLMPNISSCYAMANLLQQKQNTFYHDYAINVCAGSKAGIGLDALIPVQKSMGDPLKTKTITLSCGKLTTGVTVKPWTGVFMLRNLNSPETYFQTAFRVQSPWVVTNEEGKKDIIKQDCYVFDFALDRALRQIADYSCQLDINESSPERKVAKFMNFLPVLAYDNGSMRQVSAQDVLDFTMAGTSATLLAKRWESALLVNVDNETLNRLLNSKEALDALMRIEGFRSLNTDITTIINKSNALKQKKKEKGEEEWTKEEKKQLSEEEKEYKSKRKEIQDKLIKFATRVPVFMYLTDYREQSLKDVITQLEPGLFKKVTGLTVKDFETLCSIGVFNAGLMDAAIFHFKRYEDSSLSYTGINKHANDETVGGWDTVVRREQYQQLFYNQQATMEIELPPLPPKRPEPPKPAQPKERVVKQNCVVERPAPQPKPVQPTPKPTPAPQPKPAPAQPASKPAEKAAAFVMPELHEGMRVEHRAFGEGVIYKVFKQKFGNGQRITVRFLAKGEKTFVVDKDSNMNVFKNGLLKVIE